MKKLLTIFSAMAVLGTIACFAGAFADNPKLIAIGFTAALPFNVTMSLKFW